MGHRKKSLNQNVAASEETTLSKVGLYLVYLGLGLVTSLVWLRIADIPRLPSWHDEMIYGYAPAPNQYRPLTPWIAALLSHLMPGQSIPGAYFTLRALVTAVTLACFDRYLRTWFTAAGAAAGTICLAAILPFTYFKVVQESDTINLLVFVLAFWALANERDLYLIPLVLVGTLNRETTALIPALYLITRWGKAPALKLVLMTVTLASCWLAIYGSLLLNYGARANYADLVAVRQWNFGSIAPTVHVLLLFGAMWFLALAGRKQGPQMLVRSLWLLPPYLVVHYVVAYVREVRVFLPWAAVIIPLSWWVLFPESRSRR